MFTDGSHIDGRLPRACQSLGWAFTVLDASLNLVCTAFGVPPKWIDSIQGAELWAVNMALQHVQFPPKLYTDCNSVRQGTQRPLEWASSSKRKFARVWSCISLQLEGTPEVVQWIPAHTSKASIGEKLCSDGEIVSEEYWCSNQMVDLLAKDAANSICVSEAFRSRY